MEELARKRKTEKEGHEAERSLLAKRISELEEDCLAAKEALDGSLAKNSSLQKNFAEREAELRQDCEAQREQMAVLMGTEENLLDRLNDQHQKEALLRKDLEQHRTDLDLVRNKAKKLETELESARFEVVRRKKDGEKTAKESKEKEDRIMEKIKDLEKSEAQLSAQLTVMDSAKKHAEREEAETKARLKMLRQNEIQLKDRVTCLEETDSKYRKRVSELEELNAALKDALKDATSSHHQNRPPQECHVYFADLATADEPPDTTTTTVDQRKPRGPPDGQTGSIVYHRVPSAKIHQLDQTTKVELLSKIYQLERKDLMQTTKIQELSRSLLSFREAVEVAAVAMEADALTPTITAKVYKL